MELESEDGSKKFPIEKGSKIELGRGLLGFPADDRTVSRRHISLQFHKPSQKSSKENYSDGEIVASLQVTGKNPIWVLTKYGEEKRVFRNSDKGDLRAGDSFSISLKKPLFFTFKQRAFEAEAEEEDQKRVLKAVEGRKKRTLERKEEEEEKRVLKEDCSISNGEDTSGDLGLGSLELSQIDPVKEFGFLLMGQEFNQFPQQKIWHFKDWNWFLEEPREDSEDDQADEKEIRKRRKGRRKKKRVEVDNDDDDWTGESMDEEVLVAKLRNVKRPKHSTRSKEREKTWKDTSGKKSAQQRTISADEDENDEEDEDDDTLGGFIVNDDNLVEGEEGDEDTDDDEEEDYDEDEDDDVDNGEEDTED